MRIEDRNIETRRPTKIVHDYLITDPAVPDRGLIGEVERAKAPKPCREIKSLRCRKIFPRSGRDIVLFSRTVPWLIIRSTNSARSDER